MTTAVFTLQGEYIELKALLKLTDLVSSGGEAKMLISEGQVLVDGEVEMRKACKIRAGQQVRLGDMLIQVNAPEPHRASARRWVRWPVINRRNGPTPLATRRAASRSSRAGSRESLYRLAMALVASYSGRVASRCRRW
jgi:Uncharacterized conserved protein